MAKLFLLSCILLATAAQAQQGRAVYRLTHMYDTLARKEVKEELVLLFNTTQSVYQSRARFRYDSALATNGKQQEPRPPEASTNQIFYDFSRQQGFVTWPWLNDTLLVHQPVNSIVWTLSDAEKTIGGLACKMATGSFRGRLYTAWYAPEIPVQAGPWKLHGLPGLIVEAVDSTGTLRFELASLSNGTANLCVCINERRTKITREERTEMEDRFRKTTEEQRSQQLMSMVQPPPGVTLKAQYSSSVNPNWKSSTGVMNNPMELTK